MLCEKPLTTTLDEARRLHATVKTHDTPFVVAYTYTGFPMVMLARELVRDGEDRRGPQGRGVVSAGVAGHQARGRGPEAGGVAGRPEQGGGLGLRRRHRHARLRVRPVRRRPARPPGVQARLKAFVPGRALDDDFTVLAELDNGGIATIAASQITIGAQNDNGFRVSGTTGTLEWSITDHTVLKHYPAASRCTSTARGPSTAISPASIKPYLRLPSGHPEGFHEALANLHRTLEWTIRGRRGEIVPDPVRAPRHRRRRRRHGVHRGGRRQLEAGRRLGRGRQGRLNS